MTDWHDYFSATKPPSTLDETKKKIATFSQKHHVLNRKIVLITSGGTTVPMESNTVR